MEKKYKFTGETLKSGWITLKQVVALKDFGDVKKGDIGGWIEKEDNLSHEGDCWIYRGACVLEDAKVAENAKVYQKARVFGEARIYGNVNINESARIAGEAQIYEFASVFGGTVVYDKARIYGNANVYGESRIYGSTQLYGYANVHDNARIYGESQVYKNAVVSGNARVGGEGEILTKGVIAIDHPLHNITITDTHITIGCQNHPKEYWVGVTYEDVLKMDGIESAEAWAEFKPFILKLAGL